MLIISITLTTIFIISVFYRDEIIDFMYEYQELIDDIWYAILDVPLRFKCYMFKQRIHYTGMMNIIASRMCNDTTINLTCLSKSENFFHNKDVLTIVCLPGGGRNSRSYTETKMQRTLGYITTNPNIIVIFVWADMSYETFINTILHEMVHREQIIRGDLSFHDKDKDITFWCGKMHRLYSRFTSDTSFEKYYNMPWEIEARERANELTREILG